MAASRRARALTELLQRNATEHPGDLAVAGPRERLTWEELEARSRTIAAAIHPHNLQPGTRVCLYLASSPAWVAAFFALRRLALTAVSTGNKARPAELRDLLARFQASLVVTDNASLAGVAAVCAEAGVAAVNINETAQLPDACEVAGIAAVIHLTSGTSGVPKGVLRTEADLLEEARNVADALGLRRSDRVLCATPVYHSFASGLLLACLSSATPCLLMDRLSPAALLDLAAREGATIVAGVPYVFQTLTTLESSSDARPPFRLGVSGGAPLGEETARRFQARFGAPLVEEYGLSEAGIVSFNLGLPADVASVGKPIPNVTLTVVDPDDPAQTLPPGAAGEVVVQRASPPTEYLGHADESRATFTPFGVRTGDLGRLDVEGYLTLTGRIKSMINVAGAKVAPREVEDVLLLHPDAAEAIVFASPSADLGEAVAAVVVPRRGATPSEAALIAHCRHHLSPYKVPAAISFRADLPRTASGKPDIPRVREEFDPGGSLERLEVSL
jgi:long-chain acyl-CoA synthetase